MIAAIDQFDKFVLSAVARAVAVGVAFVARRGVREDFFDVQVVKRNRWTRWTQGRVDLAIARENGHAFASAIRHQHIAEFEHENLRIVLIRERAKMHGNHGRGIAVERSLACEIRGDKSHATLIGFMAENPPRRGCGCGVIRQRGRVPLQRELDA